MRMLNLLRLGTCGMSPRGGGAGVEEGGWRWWWVIGWGAVVSEDTIDNAAGLWLTCVWSLRKIQFWRLDGHVESDFDANIHLNATTRYIYACQHLRQRYLGNVAHALCSCPLSFSGSRSTCAPSSTTPCRLILKSI